MSDNITVTLNNEEKVKVASQVYLEHKNQHNTVKDLTQYLLNSYSKIDGFDYKWSSLITNNPLLFEDTDYIRVKEFVNNTITKEEIEAYKSGQLRDLYATFENMLICNLQYYDRIMSFCTMIFLHYVRLKDDELTNQHLDKIPFVFEMTPTQIWCCALTNTQSTEWELNYAWKINNNNFNFHKSETNSLLENNWNLLYKNQLFAKFIEYSAIRTGVNGFRQIYISDKTPNTKLSKVCFKFTRTSTALSEEHLNTLYNYINEQELINKKLYKSLFTCLMDLFSDDSTQFAIYVYSKEFFIHTTKFSMKVSKDEKGRITKEYLANSYECFLAEESLFNSMKVQIEWAKYQLPIKYDYDKMMLKSLLTNMLKDNHREITCIKRMNEFGVVSKITFRGVFDKLYIDEELMFDNRCIKSNKNCYGKSKAAQYIIDRGYFVFGLDKDVNDFSEVTKESLINHYTKYCIPVMQHMSSVITLHILSKNDIIDVVCSGILNPNKINNKNIKYADIKRDYNPRKIMQNMMFKASNERVLRKKSYWKVIEDS